MHSPIAANRLRYVLPRPSRRGPFPAPSSARRRARAASSRPRPWADSHPAASPAIRRTMQSAPLRYAPIVPGSLRVMSSSLPPLAGRAPALDGASVGVPRVRAKDRGDPVPEHIEVRHACARGDQAERHPVGVVSPRCRQRGRRSGTIGKMSVSGAPKGDSRPGGPGTFVMVRLNRRVAYSSRARLTCHAGGASSVKPTSTLLASAWSPALCCSEAGHTSSRCAADRPRPPAARRTSMTPCCRAHRPSWSAGCSPAPSRAVPGGAALRRARAAAPAGHG